MCPSLGIFAKEDQELRLEQILRENPLAKQPRPHPKTRSPEEFEACGALRVTIATRNLHPSPILDRLAQTLHITGLLEGKVCSFPGAKTVFLSYLPSAKNYEMYQKAKKTRQTPGILLLPLPLPQPGAGDDEPAAQNVKCFVQPSSPWGRIRTRDWALVFFPCFRFCFCCSTCPSTAKRS